MFIQLYSAIVESIVNGLWTPAHNSKTYTYYT